MSSPTASQPIRALLVEDNPIDRAVICRLLTDSPLLQMEIELATNLTEALECLRTEAYDLVLLDLLLPDSAGLNTITSVCQAAPQSAVVVVTGMEDEALGAEIIRAGAQDYRIKPERRKGEIARSVVHAVERKRLQVALQRERDTLEQRVRERTAELETTSGQLQSLFDNLEDMFFSIDPVSRRFLQLSPAVEQIHGRPRQDFLDDPELWKKCLHLDDVPLAEASERASAEGRPTRNEYRILRPDGELRWIEAKVKPAMDAAGAVMRLDGVVSDITARKRAEEALRESNLQLQSALEQVRAAQSKILEQERLRALGTMASGVAHDFNNALSPILGFTELLLNHPEVKLQDHERVIRYLNMMNTAARDAASIVGRLREFYRAREKTDLFLPVNLNQIVDQAISLTQPKWKDQAQAAGVSVTVESDPGKIPLVAGNESELREVLTNLIFNAVDAMPQGGTVTISTECEVSGARGDVSGNKLTPDNLSPNTVVLKVQDTGAGMSEEVRQQCLEPFFTTKGERGTGLGLAMVYGIIRRHDGTIDIASEVGKGTTIAITLPKYQPGRTVTEEVEPQTAPTRSLRALVVDDEVMIREMISGYLNDDGHEVEVATNGVEGLQKFHAGRFDLVITDRAMPEMGGDQLARTIKQTSPGKPIIMLTGFGEFMQAVSEKPEGVDEVVSKPPTLQAVRKAVTKVMSPR